MRIRTVRIQNLNSLRGEHEIDFDDEPLASAGIFAITGPTGAGKTTILDAITLALFHRISRSRSMDVITRGTPEGFAEVEFEVDDRTYRAKFAQRVRKKSGEPLERPKTKAELSIRTADGGFDFVGDQKVIAVRDRVGELLGLNYEQFSRSVILAQGEFSKFLKSSDKDRSDLLERITGTEIYGRLSTAAYERFRKEEHRLDLLKTELNAQRVLPFEEVEALKANLSAQRATAETHGRQLTTIAEQIAWLHEGTRLARTKTDLDARHRELTERTERAAPDLARLERHERAQPFAAQLTLYDDICARGKQARTELDRLAAEVPTRKTSLESAEAALNTATEQLDQTRAERERAEVAIRAAEQLDTLLTKDREARRERAAALERLVENRTAEAAALATFQQEMQRHQADLGKIVGFLEAHGKRRELPALLPRLEGWRRDETHLRNTLQRQTKQRDEQQRQRSALDRQIRELTAADAPLAETLMQLRRAFDATTGLSAETSFLEALDALREQAETLRRERERADQFAATQQQIDEQTARRDRARQQSTESTNQQESAQHQLEKQSTEAEALKHRVEKLELNYRVQQLSESVVQLRRQLTTEQPCPVCGSAHHPTEHAPPVDAPNVRPELDAARAQLQQRERERAATESEIKLLGERLEKTKQEIAAEETKLQHLREKQTAIFGDAAPRQVSEKEVLRASERIRKATDLQRRYDATQTERTQRSSDLKLNQERLRDLDAQITQVSTERSGTETELTRLRETLLQTAAQYGESFNDDLGIAPLVQLAEQSQRALSAEIKRSGELELARQRHRQTEQTLQKLTEQERTQRAELEKLDHEIAKRREKRRQLLGEQTPAAARAEGQQKVRAAEQAVKQHDAQVRTAREAVQQLATRREAQEKTVQELRARAKTAKADLDAQLERQSDFTTLSEVREARLTGEAADRLTEQRRDLKDARTRLDTQRNDHERARHEHQTRALTTEPLDRLTAQQQTLTQERNTAQKEIGALQRQLDDDEAAQKRTGELRAKTEAQDKIHQHWAQMRNLIGSKDGQRFRNFAQSLTLQQLVRYANHQLRKLTDRYELRTSGVESLALQIVDHHQAETVRGTETLSGGETFVVSLALALGLSSLNAGRTRIDSLFIDEGFGTLDDKMLETVITTLETLHGEGKTIGVISHVPALKERIGTQIRVKRLGQGTSTIEIV